MVVLSELNLRDIRLDTFKMRKGVILLSLLWLPFGSMLRGDLIKPGRMNDE